MTEKTTTGRLVAAIGGLILIISLFLKWAGVDLPDNVSIPQGVNVPDTSSNAFDLFGFSPFLYFLIGLSVVVPAALDIFDLEIELPFDFAFVALIGGALAFGGMLLVLDSPGSVKIGAYLAFIGSIAITVGGVMQMQDDEDGVEAPGYGAAPPQQAYATPAPPPQAPPAQAPPVQPPPAPQPPPQQPPQPPAV